MAKDKITIKTEVVNGKCPTCDQFTMMVNIDVVFFRCMSCGSDLEQHINGKITYLPVITTPKGAKPFVKEWLVEELWLGSGKNIWNTKLSFTRLQ